MGLTRRDLFKATAVCGGAAAMAGLTGTALAEEAPGAAGVDAGAPKYPAKRTALVTDVLVIGAGVAGTQAALDAAAAGASVIIIDKKQFGHCGDSGLHYSGRMTSSDGGLDGDCVDVQLEDAVQQGKYMVDQELGRQVLELYAENKVTLLSENYGNLHFRSKDTGKPVIFNSNNRPRQWSGYKLYNVAYRALEMGVNAMSYVTATKLLTAPDGSVAGATAVDFKTGEFYVIRAKAVVIATGGDQGLWGAGTVAAKYSGGVEGQTGDGHALAAPLGVQFRDLEFRSVSGRFGVVYPSGISNFLGITASSPATYEDGEGVKPLEENPKATSRETIIEWYKAEREGRLTEHGGFYAPTNSVVATGGSQGTVANIGYTPEAWYQCQVAWAKAGVDFEHVEVGCVHCYDYGGIVVDIDAQTGVDGLYACGECAMHSGAGYGSFRMFSSGMIMGRQAGRAAAKRAGEIDLGAIDMAGVEAEFERVYGVLYNEPADGVRACDMKHRIQDSAWKGSGSLRSEKRCNEALAELDAEEAELASVYVKDKSPVCNVEWMEALALPNMIAMARLDTIASMTRTESRGTHFRAEYPEENNDEWIKNVYLKQVDGQIEVDVRDAIITDFPAPEGKTDQGGGILEDF